MPLEVESSSLPETVLRPDAFKMLYWREEIEVLYRTVGGVASFGALTGTIKGESSDLLSSTASHTVSPALE